MADSENIYNDYKTLTHIQGEYTSVFGGDSAEPLEASSSYQSVGAPELLYADFNSGLRDYLETRGHVLGGTYWGGADPSAVIIDGNFSDESSDTDVEKNSDSDVEEVGDIALLRVGDNSLDGLTTELYYKDDTDLPLNIMSLAVPSDTNIMRLSHYKSAVDIKPVAAQDDVELSTYSSRRI
jgi:hypothetical protein